MNEGLIDIIEQCQAKNEKGFEALYKKYYRVLHSIAIRYCRTSFEADDVLQDAFIKIFHNIDSYSPEGSFEGWLKRIVQNTAINNYKSNLKYNLHVPVLESEDIKDNENIDSIFGDFEAKDILLLLNKLPDGYRIIINLFCLDGFTHKEIAKQLNITEGTSKSQLFKAKAYLKRLVDTEFNRKMNKMSKPIVTLKYQ
ncbi:MAG: RNA polymerase sigma factor [Bacteroidota bacterium]